MTISPLGMEFSRWVFDGRSYEHGGFPRSSRRQLRGELLEVLSGSLLVRTEDAIVEVPFPRIYTPPALALDELRAGARFPLGLTEEARARLVEALGFDEIRLLGSDYPLQGGDP